MDESEKIYLGDIAENTSVSGIEGLNDSVVTAECIVFIVVSVIVSVLFLIFPELAEKTERFLRAVRSSGIKEILIDFLREIKDVFI